MSFPQFTHSRVLGKYTPTPPVQSEDEARLAALRVEMKSIKCRLDSRKYRARSETSQKEAARIAVASAVRNGSLIALPCVCGDAKTEAHHDNYSKPLEVRWLCKGCHAAHHRDQKTHCAKGHPWTPENIYTMPSGKRHYCVTCRQLRNDTRTDRMAETKVLRKENTDQKTRIATLEADLLECREYIEDHVDVVDGSDGPQPNRAMALVSMIDETLHGPGNFR